MNKLLFLLCTLLVCLPFAQVKAVAPAPEPYFNNQSEVSGNNLNQVEQTQIPETAPLQATNFENTEHIAAYNTTIVIYPQEIKVEERILYDFGSSTGKHGIIRSIPYSYKTKTGSTTHLDFSNFSVRNELGAALAVTKKNESGSVILKIGESGKTVSGEQNYIISYTVSGAINFFENQDELYWNAIGTEWTVPIAVAQVEVRLADEAKKITQAVCYTGAEQSQESLCTAQYEGAQTLFRLSKSLFAEQGFTIVTGFEKNFAIPFTTQEKFWRAVRANGILGLPLLVGAIALYIWNRYGRNARKQRVIIPEYAPPQLSPLEAGVIADFKLDPRDVTADIVQLAVQGYIKIIHQKKKSLHIFNADEFILEKVAGTKALSPYQASLLDLLFANRSTVTVTALAADSTFKKELALIQKKVFEDLTAAGYFKQNPRSLQSGAVILFIVVLMLGFAFGLDAWGVFGVIALVVSAAILSWLLYVLPALTERGVTEKEYILGLKQYMNVAEKDRLKFHNAPEKNAAQFETLLPYAIALGVDKAWAAAFKDITIAQPQWYQGPAGMQFNSIYLANSLTTFSSSAQQNFSGTTASSGGSGFSGGFSGGGGGGGGGGSW